MQLTKIVGGGGCHGDNCPTIYVTDRGTAVVQGYRVTDPEALASANPPANEGLLEVPLDLLRGVPGIDAAG